MPPLSETSRWESIRSITGYGLCGIELGRVGPRHAQDVAGELDRHDLHPQAQPETGQIVLPGVGGRSDLALDPPFAEAAGDHDAVQVVEAVGGQQPLDVLGLDPLDGHVGTVVEPGVLEGLDHRQVGVGQADVLADDPDPGREVRLTDPTHQVVPFLQVRLDLGQAEDAAHDLVEALVVEHQRDVVEAVGIGGVDHRVRPARRTARRSCASGRCDTGSSERHTIASGWIPRLRSSVTECCVGLVFCSPDGPMKGTRVTWT